MIINRYILLHDVGGIKPLILRTITLHKINLLCKQEQEKKYRDLYSFKIINISKIPYFKLFFINITCRLKN